MIQDKGCQQKRGTKTMTKHPFYTYIQLVGLYKTLHTAAEPEKFYTGVGKKSKA